ncbi:reverse transcriptase family protein, partial [Enterobacter cloacae complex sp. GF14B]|uniref:reverse transcriptase family protein n=1 Tax=Enterobacter cloacae complex sp. GF14B TaxID=2511982 RepID=UPI001027ED8A
KNKRNREYTESKLERRNKYRELKKTLKKVWTTEIESGEDENVKIKENMDVPSHYRKFTIENRKVILTPPIRERKEKESYDGPEDAKKVDLAAPGEPPRPVYIATDLSPGEEERLLSLLREYRDVFAWSYKDLKGVDPSICQHSIPLKQDAKPSRQRPYTYNDTFAKRIKEEIDKLMEAEFIYEIEHTDWVSPIVVVPKKNGKLRVCVNLKKVNAATIRDNYPLPITDHVLERVSGKTTYSFLDGFSGYNQLAIAPEDQHKTAFATEWGIYAYRVMPFGLTNAPATFQRLMTHAFKEYLRLFLEIYMDDLCVHSLLRDEHLEHL